MDDGSTLDGDIAELRQRLVAFVLEELRQQPDGDLSAEVLGVIGDTVDARLAALEARIGKGSGLDDPTSRRALASDVAKALKRSGADDAAVSPLSPQAGKPSGWRGLSPWLAAGMGVVAGAVVASAIVLAFRPDNSGPLSPDLIAVLAPADGDAEPVEIGSDRFGALAQAYVAEAAAETDPGRKAALTTRAARAEAIAAALRVTPSADPATDGEWARRVLAANSLDRLSVRPLTAGAVDAGPAETLIDEAPEAVPSAAVANRAPTSARTTAPRSRPAVTTSAEPPASAPAPSTPPQSAATPTPTPVAPEGQN